MSAKHCKIKPKVSQLNKEKALRSNAFKTILVVRLIEYGYRQAKNRYKRINAKICSTQV